MTSDVLHRRCEQPVAASLALACALGLFGATAVACSSPDGAASAPVAVDPAADGDGAGDRRAAGDGGTRAAWDASDLDASRDPADGAPRDHRDPTRPRPGVGTGTGLWVVDAAGVDAGVLMRRGSDDNVADRAIYDVVTVFHPASGLFYDLAMAGGVVLYPGTTFFAGAGCDVPVGLGVGGCTDCRAGFGLGVLHEGAWYEVVGGAAYEQASAGATISSGVSASCVPHSTFNAKVFPIVGVPPATTTPPTSFTPPLHFEWR